MPDVLMISFFFPPLGGAGVQRSLKFAKYLPSFGWKPTILTIKNDVYALKDASLEKDIPEDINIIRTKAILLPRYIPWKIKNWISRWLFVVDEYLGWYPFANTKAKQIIREKKIKIIYTTSSPYSSHIIGLHLNNLTGLPWIADFRDPWLDNFDIHFPTPLHLKLNRHLEKQVIENASAITVVSDPMRKSLVDRYTEDIGNKIHVIPNGYDQEDFTNIKQPSKNNKFTIVYTGSFYSKGLTPVIFFKALALALERCAIPRDRIEVNFFGNIGKIVRQQIDSYGLNDIVFLKGYVPHQESISYLIEADVLLLVIGSGAGSENITTGKLYEYFAAHKPILALTGKGAAENIIRQANAGVIVSPENSLEVCEQIIYLYQKWKNNELYFNGNDDIIARYERKKLTGQLASLMSQLSR